MEFTVGSWRLVIEQVNPSVEELSQKYNAAAPNWHQSIQRMGFIKAYRSIFAEIRDSCYSEVPALELDVLDVGIGTGGLSQALLREEKRPVHLTGIDISADMLDQTRSNLINNVESLDLLQQDMQDLQLADNQFDFVMGAHVLEHLPKMDRGVQEMVRVAKPGAPILLMVTRRGLASSWLHLIWQIRTANERQVYKLFQLAGLEDIQFIRFRSPIWCNWMSIAIIGCKRS